MLTSSAHIFVVVCESTCGKNVNNAIERTCDAQIGNIFGSFVVVGGRKQRTPSASPLTSYMQGHYIRIICFHTQNVGSTARATEKSHDNIGNVLNVSFFSWVPPLHRFMLFSLSLVFFFSSLLECFVPSRTEGMATQPKKITEAQQIAEERMRGNIQNKRNMEI